jgi:hypothetical protein
LSLGNCDEPEIKLINFVAPNDLSNNLIMYCTRALNHPVYENVSYRHGVILKLIALQDIGVEDDDDD